MVTAGNHPLLRTLVARDGSPVVEHLVIRLDDQQIASRRDARYVEFFPLGKMRLGKRVTLAGMQIFLRPEEGAQADVRIDRRVDKHRVGVVLLREIRGVEAAKRGAHKTHRGIRGDQALNRADRVGGKRRQCRARIVVAQTLLLHIAAKDLRLVRLGRRIEPVQVDDQAAAPCSCASRSRSRLWMPPKPPFDITRTWSPLRASAATAPISASKSAKQRTFWPNGANTAAASQPSPALYTKLRSACARLAGRSSFIPPRFIVLERGSSTASTRALPTFCRKPSSVVRIAVG